MKLHRWNTLAGLLLALFCAVAVPSLATAEQAPAAARDEATAQPAAPAEPTEASAPTPPSQPEQAEPAEAATEAASEAPDAEKTGEASEAKAAETPATDAKIEAAPAPADTKPAKPAKKKTSRNRHNNPQGEPFQRCEIKEGEVVNDAVSVFAYTRVAGETLDDAVAIFGSNTVTGKVGGDAVSVFGNLHVNGEVLGDALSVFGSTTFGPKAVVHGNVATVFGSVHRDPAAQIQGKEENIGGSLGSLLGGMQTWVDLCLRQGRLLAFSMDVAILWIITGVAMLFNLLVAACSPRGTRACMSTLNEQPGSSLLSTLMTVLLTPLLIVLLAVTGIGAVLIPFVVIGLICITIYGHAVMQAWLGQALGGLLNAGKPLAIAVASLLGGFLTLLLMAVPVLGMLILPLLGLLGTGVVVNAMVRRYNAGRVARQAAHQAATAAKAQVPRPLQRTSPAASAAASIPVPPVIVSPLAAPAANAMPTSTATPDIPPLNLQPAAPQPPVLPGMPAVPAYPSVDLQLPPPPVLPSPESVPAAVTPETSKLSASAAATLPATDEEANSSLPRASFGLRMVALLIDVILIYLVINSLQSLTPSFLHFNKGNSLPLVPLALYGTLMWKYRAATIGHIIMGLQVVRTDDKPLDWTTCVVRGLGSLLSGFAIGLGFLWILVDPEKAAWHDKIAGTAVVRIPKNKPLL